jgi:hypothetical protein
VVCPLEQVRVNAQCDGRVGVAELTGDKTTFIPSAISSEAKPWRRE